jgi:hypothetical protein
VSVPIAARLGVRHELADLVTEELATFVERRPDILTGAIRRIAEVTGELEQDRVEGRTPPGEEARDGSAPIP